MGRPPTYRTINPETGKPLRVPGVTTVAKRYGDPGGLIHWAHDLGLQGLDYRKVRDAAANIGTWAHDRVEAWCMGWDDPSPPADFTAEQIEAGQSSWRAFEEWAHGSALKVDRCEVPMVYYQAARDPEDSDLRAHLGFELPPFGGTWDAVGTMAGRSDLVLVDWKTSGRVGPEMLVQMGGYQILLRYGVEVDDKTGKPIEPKAQPRFGITGVHLARFSKEHGDFEHRYFPLAPLPEAFADPNSPASCFARLRLHYGAHAVLKKRTA